jgi:hypothetical protein
MRARTPLALLALLLTAALGGPAAAQGAPPDRSAEVRAALARLPIGPGTWEGEAWHRRGPGEPETIHQTERVETRLDGVVLLVEGTGRDAEGAVVFQAFATLGWDPASEEYRMTAWLADGSVTDAEASFADGVFTWGFQPPGGPRIRYHVRSPEAGVWQEDGEVSLDGGATWMPFFGMTLRRQGGGEG